jgi:hypothetical protein
LGVSDIRIIPSAQFNKMLSAVSRLSDDFINKYPILKYRVNNIRQNRHVRGLQEHDCNRCRLVWDDMAVAGNYHFPCIIYLREKGDPIGEIGPKMRQERFDWSKTHDCLKDEICRRNCLDVCVAHNRFKEKCIQEASHD